MRETVPAPARASEVFISPRGTLIVLLVTTAVLLLGSGLFGTLLGVRATLEGFQTSTIGVVMSAYFVGFLVGTFVCVRVVERVGHIRAFAAFTAIFAVMALAHSLWVHPLAWMLFRFVSGIAAVGLALIIESWLNAQAPSESRGRVFSIYMVVNLSAVALGQLLLTTADPAAFALFAIAAMLFALASVPTALVRVQAPIPQQTDGLGLRALLSLAPVGVAGCFAVGIVGGAFWGMAPVFVTEIGYAQEQVALFMFVTIVGGMLAQFPIGRYSDAHDRRKVIAGVTLLASGAALAVSFSAQIHFGALLGAAFLFGAFNFPIYGLAVARTHDVVAPEQGLAATQGLMLVFGVGAALGPFFAGLVMSLLGAAAVFLWIAVVFGALVLFSLFRLTQSFAVPVAEQKHFVPLQAATTSQEVLEMAESVVYEERSSEAPPPLQPDAENPSGQA